MWGTRHPAIEVEWGSAFRAVNSARKWVPRVPCIWEPGTARTPTIHGHSPYVPSPYVPAYLFPSSLVPCCCQALAASTIPHPPFFSGR